MTNHSLKEIGSIKDVNGFRFDVYAEVALCDIKTKELTIKNVTLEGVDSPAVYRIESLASMPSRFSEQAIADLEWKFQLREEEGITAYQTMIGIEMKRILSEVTE